jgi:Tfp pilus assembly protein PilF
MRVVLLVVLLAWGVAFSPVSLRADPPEIKLGEWKDAFAADPKLFEAGVHPVDAPEKAFVITGRVPRALISLKTERDREIATKRAELAAKGQLFEFVYRRDKGLIKLPAHLDRFADEALKFDAHSRTLTVQGMQTAATWVDDTYVWCTLVVGQTNVKRTSAIADQFRLVGAKHYLQQYGKNKQEADLFRAFEIDPDSKEVRTSLSNYFLAQGHKVASFVIQTPQPKLPPRDDAFGRFLADLKNPAWEEGLAHFQAVEPDLDRARAAFLRALETRYVDGDNLNYIGACFRSRGWHRLASVFFEQALMQSEKQLHPYALTNLGLCLIELDQPEAARRYLQQAVATFPDEEWTEHSRKALARLTAEKTP